MPPDCCFQQGTAWQHSTGNQLNFSTRLNQFNRTWAARAAFCRATYGQQVGTGKMFKAYRCLQPSLITKKLEEWIVLSLFQRGFIYFSLFLGITIMGTTWHNNTCLVIFNIRFQAPEVQTITADAWKTQHESQIVSDLKGAISNILPNIPYDNPTQLRNPHEPLKSISLLGESYHHLKSSKYIYIYTDVF